jgi:hypothetical protein
MCPHTFYQRLIASAISAVLTLFAGTAMAQTATNEAMVSANSNNQEKMKSAAETVLTEELQKLRRVIEQLEARIKQLEDQEGALQPGAVSETVADNNAASITNHSRVADTAISASQAQTLSSDDRGVLDFFRGTTINATIDGYYGYNFNRPIGRINLLRAYDIQSNSFSLNQATLAIEHAPDVEAGRRFGARLDFMYGQATETLQGNPANELRPQAYRPIFQAYGTYVFPIGKGLTVDFGKFASALGPEGNFTKDQMNYSRSYFFNYLPFYHFGFRTTYQFNDKFTATHWLVNGANQSEDFNGFKSQAIILNIKPIKKISWNVNYYTGLEGRDLNPALNPGFAPLPTQPGLSTDVIKPAPRGRFHVIDSYATINVTDKLAFLVEGDYVINRAQTNSLPSRVTGGAAYARYQFTSHVAAAGRFVYLSDRGGLFSGVTQALKDTTLTFDYKFTEGFLMRAEWRRDFSNQAFFLTNQLGVLKKEQNTATLGLVWWFGRKQGGW